MKPFERIEHTADAGIRVYGKTLEELFENGAKGMTDVIARGIGQGARTVRHLSIETASLEDLYLKWLRELLFLFAKDKFLFYKNKKVSITDNRLEADVEGEILDPARHELGMEIKAVTYHQFQLRSVPQGFEAQVIFDV